MRENQHFNKSITHAEKPYNSLSDALKKEFGRKMIKLSTNGGFTCPNRDGSKGTGGCTFCSSLGSGENVGTIDEEIELLSMKWRGAGYIAYFQNYTNTYAPVGELRETYGRALSDPRISGIAVATRPDCLGDDVVELLADIARERYMWVELGLQTTNESIARSLNRCCTLSDYDDAVRRLSSNGIRVVTHLILGLPGESRDDMTASVKYVCSGDIWGIKLHLLNIVRGSALADTHPEYCAFNGPDDYASFICDLLEIIPPDIVIHRLSGDAPADILMTPKWAYRKRLILNKIEHEMKRRGSVQGCKYEVKERYDG